MAESRTSAARFAACVVLAIALAIVAVVLTDGQHGPQVEGLRRAVRQAFGSGDTSKPMPSLIPNANQLGVSEVQQCKAAYASGLQPLSVCTLDGCESEAARTYYIHIYTHICILYM